MNLSQQPNIIYGVSNKDDSNMSFIYGNEREVVENRKKFLNKFNIDLKDLVVMQVEHKNNITILGKDYIKDGKPILTEALITKEKDLVLFLLTADCLPVALYDPKQGVIALAHLGWKPTGERLLEKVVNSMRESFRSDPEGILVEIGPSIKKESYKLTVLEQKDSSDWLPFLEGMSNEETAVDLTGFNKKQLLDNGILEENIKISEIDTATSKDYFSHYRSVKTGESEGRFATIIGLK